MSLSSKQIAYHPACNTMRCFNALLASVTWRFSSPKQPNSFRENANATMKSFHCDITLRRCVPVLNSFS